MTIHESVLLNETLDLVFEGISKTEEGVVVDCTLGGGGHTLGCLDRIEKLGLKGTRVVSMDRDCEAIENAKIRFSNELKEGKLTLVHAEFGRLPEHIDAPVLGLIADLGYSSDQLEQPERGLSFTIDGPLDMRLDPTSGQPLSEKLRTWSEREMADLIFRYGEERYSRRIARTIADLRRDRQLPKTTLELANVVSRCYPAQQRRGRIHPATRTFQAFRIAINEELDQLRLLLDKGIFLLKPNHRVGIISFHSLEDRMVKQAFRRDGFTRITKKPIVASQEEIDANPRSRSAKLRVAFRSN